MRTEYWRKYEIDEHALEVIDAEGKAYVLGFITADGAVDGDGLNFTLHEQDIDILAQIKNVLGSTHKIRPIARKRVSLDVCSRSLARRLINLGLQSPKTFTVGPPTEIPQDLLPHWLRGYWDGDGWLTVRKRASGIVPRIRIAGWSRALMEYVQRLCCEYAGADLTLGAYRGGWSVGMESLNAKRWIERVYLPATIVSRRKWILAVDLYNLPDLSLSEAQRTRRRKEYHEQYEVRNRQIVSWKSNGVRTKDIAMHFGLTPSGVCAVLSRYSNDA
jgi:hypothetical protein